MDKGHKMTGNEKMDNPKKLAVDVSKEEVDQTSENKDKKTITWLRLSKTVLLVLSYFGMGMSKSLLFACLPDLRVRLGTDVEGISYAFALGSFGALVSTPLGAVADRFGNYSELILGCCLTLSAVSNIIRPYTSKLWVFGVSDFVDDVAWGLVSNVGNSLVILMWGASGNPALHAMHFGFPVGATLGGQIARAFVSTNTTDNNTSSNSLETDNFFQWSFLPAEFAKTLPGVTKEFPDDSRIEIGFMIISSFSLVLAIFFTLFQFMGKRRLKKQASKQSFKWSEILNPSKWASGNAKFGLFIFIMSTLFQIALQGCDKGLAQYLTTYAVDSDLGFDNQEAASLSSIYYLLDAVGIFSCIFIARYLSSKAMFLIEVHGIVISSILLIIFGARSKIALYILAPAFALFKGPAWATSYAWPDFYIILLSALLGVTRISRNITDIFMNAFQGYLYSNTVIETIFYTTFAYGALLCILVYIVYYYTWNKPGRHQISKELHNDKVIYINSIVDNSIIEETDSFGKSAEPIVQTLTTHL